MNNTQFWKVNSFGDWPLFELQYTFEPRTVGDEVHFDAEELVIFNSSTPEPCSQWISAKQGSYVAVDEIR